MSELKMRFNRKNKDVNDTIEKKIEVKSKSQNMASMIKVLAAEDFCDTRSSIFNKMITLSLNLSPYFERQRPGLACQVDAADAPDRA